MPDNINNLDSKDEGLKAIFGDRFHDATEAPQTGGEATVTNNTASPAKTAKIPSGKPTKATDETWEPEKHEPSITDNLKECAKFTCLYAGLSFLIFYWAQAGLMDVSVAIPCNWIFLFLAGYSVGKCFRGRR